MKKHSTLTLLALSFSFLLNSCVYEETVVVAPPMPEVELYYDFWAGPRHVEIDGELFNEGNTFIRSVELEVTLFDEFGEIISMDLITVNAFIHPGEIHAFGFDLWERYVFDVDIVVRRMFT